MFGKRFTRALVVATVATMAMASVAFADQLALDGDSDVLKVGNNIQYVVTPGAQDQQRACSTRGTAVTGTATLEYSGNTNAPHWTPGETADVTYTETTASDITVSGPATITVPANWNDTTDTHNFNFTTTTPTTVADGQYEITVSVEGRTSGLEKSKPFIVDINCGSSTPPACDNYFVADFLKPFDGSTPGGSLINNQVKNGRTVPVKVEIFEVNCETDERIGEVETGLLTHSTAAVKAAATNDPVESYADAGASSGNTNTFRWSSDGFWIFNLNTKDLGLQLGQTYQINLFLNGTQITNAYGLFTPTK